MIAPYSVDNIIVKAAALRRYAGLVTFEKLWDTLINDGHTISISNTQPLGLWPAPRLCCWNIEVNLGTDRRDPDMTPARRETFRLAQAYGAIELGVTPDTPSGYRRLSAFALLLVDPAAPAATVPARRWVEQQLDAA